jgi:hypothetical protein
MTCGREFGRSSSEVCQQLHIRKIAGALMWLHVGMLSDIYSVLVIIVCRLYTYKPRREQPNDTYISFRCAWTTKRAGPQAISSAAADNILVLKALQQMNIANPTNT